MLHMIPHSQWTGQNVGSAEGNSTTRPELLPCSFVRLRWARASQALSSGSCTPQSAHYNLWR